MWHFVFSCRIIWTRRWLWSSTLTFHLPQGSLYTHADTLKWETVKSLPYVTKITWFKLGDSYILLVTLSPFLFCLSLFLSLSLSGDEEDHDNDWGGWPRIGGSFLHARLPQVCAGGHTYNRVWLHTAACHYLSVTILSIIAIFSTSQLLTQHIVCIWHGHLNANSMLLGWLCVCVCVVHVINFLLCVHISYFEWKFEYYAVESPNSTRLIGSKRRWHACKPSLWSFPPPLQYPSKVR